MSALEQHYTPKELAKMWGVSRQSVRRRLEQYLHLIPDFNGRKPSRFGPLKRRNAFLRVPKSLAERIYRDFMGDGRSA